jgi:large subunit ribosomal protein L13
MMENKIDATKRSLGRVASEAAFLLMGKHETSFTRNRKPETKVSVVNASRMTIPPKKLTDKKYVRHSFYPGGQKELSLEKLIAKSGYSEVVRRAVYGMLPDNKLRKIMMSNLTVSE